MTNIDSLQKTPDLERQDTLPVKSCSQIDKLKEELVEGIIANTSIPPGFTSQSYLREAIDHLASQGRILQEGFVAVPVEPTREMLNAGMFAPTARRSPSDTAEIIYKAMIAAQEGKE